MKNEKTEIISRVKKYGRAQALMQYVNIETLTEAYWELMENDVAVVVGVKYGENLEKNLSDLLIRMHNCSYFPQSQDWLQRVDMDGHYKKYIFRAFEDRIVQYRFRKILEAIYKPKIQGCLADLEKKMPIKKSRGKIRMYVAWVEVDVEKLLSKINQENLINFLEQDISDKGFLRYIRRFFQSGTKMIGICTDSESESVISFLSMLCNVCVYYTLQILGTTQDWGLDGEMSVRWRDKCFLYLFDKVGDAQIIYRRLYQGLKKEGVDVTKDKVCTLSSVFNNKRRFGKVVSSRRTVTRGIKRRKRINLTKELSMKISD